MASLMMKLYVKALQAKQTFLEEERGAVDIVAIVILIGVAVALALFFKDQITNTMSKLFTNIDTAAGEATSKIPS